MESVRTRRATLTGSRKEKEKEIPLVCTPDVCCWLFKRGKTYGIGSLFLGKHTRFATWRLLLSCAFARLECLPDLLLGRAFVLGFLVYLWRSHDFQVPEPVQAMTDSELVKALAVLGIAAGPITSSSRTLYERIYVRKLNEKAEEDAKTETSSVNEEGEKKQPKRRSTRKSASNTSASDSHQTNSASTSSPAQSGNALAAAAASASSAHEEQHSSQDAHTENGIETAEPEAASAQQNAASAPPAVDAAEVAADAEAASHAQAQDSNPTPEPAGDLADLPSTGARNDNNEQLDPLFSDDEEASSYEVHVRAHVRVLYVFVCLCVCVCVCVCVSVSVSVFVSMCTCFTASSTDCPSRCLLTCGRGPSTSSSRRRQWRMRAPSTGCRCLLCSWLFSSASRSTRSSRTISESAAREKSVTHAPCAGPAAFSSGSRY
jgi:hypothetical protein